MGDWSAGPGRTREAWREDTAEPAEPDEDPHTDLQRKALWYMEKGVQNQLPCQQRGLCQQRRSSAQQCEWQSPQPGIRRRKALIFTDRKTLQQFKAQKEAKEQQRNAQMASGGGANKEKDDVE
ncbi:hypothetical protein NDU88_002230 [Pleurodeles waltl]|uniref:Uncharacterized protein n=1 Tax=Pleurodeles waltl TaxID=8319 RepID=A0AAV7WKM7_PLEWA|nr:hypothetical protein NDU88_002230 [Pleurodeles waltl]